ncbi:unnamed protein product, partial [Didymodactylos carnosus]
LLIPLVCGHGYLQDPPARSSAWLYDPAFEQCCTYSNHMEMFCGGLQHQWNQNGGKCGICGEPYDKTDKVWEKGGSMYLGKTVRTYRKGQTIRVSVTLTANHKGYFEFRLCNVDGWSSDATQACLDQNVLEFADGTHRFKNVGDYGSTKIDLDVKLPSNVKCDHCVFQWKYTTGNNWGTDPQTGQSCGGCGAENETFMGCADIRIDGEGNGNEPTEKPQPQTTRKTQEPPQVVTQTTTR